jgi:cytochrome subunit of sulfide dehydrogenase
MKIFSTLTIGLLAFGDMAHAQDRNLGRNLAAQCANCHGTNGNAQPGGFTLAGRDRKFIVDQMAAFKSGVRTGPAATIMHQISRGYSDEQIALMADYFAAQKPAK